MPVFKNLTGMRGRCYNKNYTGYCNYGGRGITICEEWKYNFAQFLKDVGHKPSKKYSLDRINNDGNYEPNNVRWASSLEQVHNRRSICKLEQEIQQLKTQLTEYHQGINAQCQIQN